MSTNLFAGRRARRRLALFVSLLLLALDAAAQSTPWPTPTPPIFVRRQIGVIPPPTPTPQYRGTIEEEAKPIPREWLIGGGIGGALLLVGIFYGATRAWRSSNLFDRQYRFPTNAEPALRLGGQKCGGHLAQVRFGKAGNAPSKTKNT